MIRCEVKQHNQAIRSFRISGHAGFADSGEDVVCAAVSVLVINAINSCEALLGDEPDVKETEEELLCRLRNFDSERVQLLFQSMVYGLRDIAKQYPQHVRVRIIQSEE